MTSDQLLAAPGAILHFPTVLGGVVPVYNIPGVRAELKFTGQILADIYLAGSPVGQRRHRELNAGISLPSSDITVVHRAEGSGTPIIFADYLGKISPDWKKRVGVAPLLNWPVGLEARGMKASPAWCSRHPARSATSN